MSFHLKKALVFFGLAVILVFFLELFFLPVTAYAEDIITNRTGRIKITQPDGTVLVVGKDKALGLIPSGSTVEVLSGSVDIAPTKGFIQIVIGDTVATVQAGDRVTASVDPQTKMADFAVDEGKVRIIAGNTTVMVKADQQAQVGLDKYTGKVKVKSISGNIDTATAGVRTLVLQGGLAEIRVDSETRQVQVNSTDGLVEVISLEGRRFILARGESKDVQGSMAGEVLSFPGEVVEAAELPAEEPTEPETPEASPYR